MDAIQVYQELPHAIRELHTKLTNDARAKTQEGQREAGELNKMKLSLAAFDANG